MAVKTSVVPARCTIASRICREISRTLIKERIWKSVALRAPSCAESRRRRKESSGRQCGMNVAYANRSLSCRNPLEGERRVAVKLVVGEVAKVRRRRALAAAVERVELEVIVVEARAVEAGIDGTAGVQHGLIGGDGRVVEAGSTALLAVERGCRGHQGLLEAGGGGDLVVGALVGALEAGVGIVVVHGRIHAEAVVLERGRVEVAHEAEHAVSAEELLCVQWKS